ncbi:MAG TPA: TIGR04222 domain-containing membrane protein, partial [Acidimicrobiales bacterium]|nr:TIGR04222 domain-containing membrane protein [Acidimicrobiales bacterium]
MSTWGIDGPAFLGIYIGLAALIVVAALLVDRRHGSPSEVEDRDEYEIALLAGGARLAAIVALVNLDRRGVIELGDGLLRQLRDSGDLDLDAVRDADHLADLGVELHVSLPRAVGATDALGHPLEAAALQAARGTKPRTPWRVVSAVTGTRAIRELQAGLVRGGLLYGADDVERMQARWRWLLPMMAAGGVRVLADSRNGEPVVALLAAMLVTVVAMRRLSRRQPVNTRRGDRLVRDLRRRRAELEDACPPSGASPGLALALAGTAGLWAIDPALALAVAAPTPVEDESSGEGWWDSARGWLGSGGHQYGGWSGGAGCGGGGGWS